MFCQFHANNDYGIIRAATVFEAPVATLTTMPAEGTMMATEDDTPDRPIVTRAQALEKGLERYYTGTPCRNGHIAERYTNFTNCVKCTQKNTRARYDRDPKAEIARSQLWLKNNPERAREIQNAGSRRYRKRHPDRQKAFSASWRSKNLTEIQAKDRQKYQENREARIAKSRRWNIANAEKVAAREAKRRAVKYAGTPPWADLDAITAIYAECARISAETGIKHHVDHIVPLRGKNVRGLHVHYNLQILEARANMAKGNRLLEDALS